MSANEMDFKSFRKIPALHSSPLRIRITQKIHGTNGQLLIWKDKEGEMHLKAGSRNRWLTPEDDNYGFAKWAYFNKDSLIRILGAGRHFGEWAGKGINKGEGLETKKFFLFDYNSLSNFWALACSTESREEAYHFLWEEIGILTVPLLKEINLFPEILDCPLIRGNNEPMLGLEKLITEELNSLKKNGSHIVPGYMCPEGIVIEIYDEKRINPSIFFKKTFSQEESPWEGKKEKIIPTNLPDVSHLLQPLRLEKLLSRDEKYLRDYPNSLKDIATDYVKDLEEENQFQNVADEELKALKKALGRSLFNFIKSEVENNDR